MSTFRRILVMVGWNELERVGRTADWTTVGQCKDSKYVRWDPPLSLGL